MLTHRCLDPSPIVGASAISVKRKLNGLTDLAVPIDGDSNHNESNWGAKASRPSDSMNTLKKVDNQGECNKNRAASATR